MFRYGPVLIFFNVFVSVLSHIHKHYDNILLRKAYTPHMQQPISIEITVKYVNVAHQHYFHIPSLQVAGRVFLNMRVLGRIYSIHSG